MNSSPKRRRKKLNGGSADQTRAAFLAAAKRVFAERAYDQAGLRDIAAIAGADKRLITRYFNSKEGLFAAALRDSNAKFEGVDPRDALENAQRIFGASDVTDEDRLGFISLCLHAATSRSGKRLVRTNVRQQVAQMASQLTGKEAALRAALILAVCFGTALVREVLRIEPLVNMGAQKARTYWAPLLQHLADGQAPRSRATSGVHRRARTPPDAAPKAASADLAPR